MKRATFLSIGAFWFSALFAAPAVYAQGPAEKSGFEKTLEALDGAIKILEKVESRRATSDSEPQPGTRAPIEIPEPTPTAEPTSGATGEQGGKKGSGAILTPKVVTHVSPKYTTEQVRSMFNHDGLTKVEIDFAAKSLTDVVNFSTVPERVQFNNLQLCYQGANDRANGISPTGVIGFVTGPVDLGDMTGIAFTSGVEPKDMMLKGITTYPTYGNYTRHLMVNCATFMRARTSYVDIKNKDPDLSGLTPSERSMVEFVFNDVESLNQDSRQKVSFTQVHLCYSNILGVMMGAPSSVMGLASNAWIANFYKDNDIGGGAISEGLNPPLPRRFIGYRAANKLTLDGATNDAKYGSWKDRYKQDCAVVKRIPLKQGEN